jgi:hypothetical protein
MGRKPNTPPHPSWEALGYSVTFTFYLMQKVLPGDQILDRIKDPGSPLPRVENQAEILCDEIALTILNDPLISKKAESLSGVNIIESDDVILTKVSPCLYFNQYHRQLSRIL